MSDFEANLRTVDAFLEPFKKNVAGHYINDEVLLAEISRDAGIPAGVWNTINGFGEVMGKAIAEHPTIKAVALVGETATGSLIMRQGMSKSRDVSVRRSELPVRKHNVTGACNVALTLFAPLTIRRV